MGEKGIFSYLFKYRQHPLTIFNYITRSFWLLLIPLTRSLVAMKFNIAEWLKGAWLDILIVSVIFGFAFLRWFFISFKIEDEYIQTGTGYFGLIKSKIYYKEASSVTCSQGPILRLFRAYKINIDTNSNAALFSKHNITLIIKRSEFEKLYGIIRGHGAGLAKFSYQPKKTQLFIFSFLFSSTISGVVLIATLLYQGSRIVGREIEQQLLLDINNQVAQFVTISLPPITIAIVLVIVVGWLYSFFINLIRHWDFTAVRQGSNIIIQSGIVTRQINIIDINRINFIDTRQSFLMRIFKICSVNINCAGYGKSNEQISVLVPITTNEEMLMSLKILVPKFPRPKLTLRSRILSMLSFLMPPIIIVSLFPVAAYILSWIFPEWESIIMFAMLIFLIPGFWFIVVKFASIFTTGIGFSDDYATLSYCRFYTFHTVVVPIKRISMVATRQTIFQIFNKECEVKVYTNSEKTTYHRIKNFRQKNVLEELAAQGFDLH
ncbi:MAG: PH domain-containing protein [Ruminococcus sp.]|nr:PH domain-containing protein [Ruminococcus sp.]